MDPTVSVGNVLLTAVKRCRWVEFSCFVNFLTLLIVVRGCVPVLCAARLGRKGVQGP